MLHYAPVKRTPSQSDREIGQRIRQLRADNKMSSQTLAERLDVTRGAVGNWELGQGIKRDNLQKIANVFKVSFEWLATGRGSPQMPAPPQSVDARLNQLRMIEPDLSDDLHEQIDVLIDHAIERITRRAQ